MGQIIYITGGAKSGKSSFAEQSIQKAQLDSVAYIATMANNQEDPELQRSIALHRSQRPEEWTTIEAYRDLDQVILEESESHQGILVDCVTLWISNNLFDYWQARTKVLGLDLEGYWKAWNQQEAEKTETFLMEKVDRLKHSLKASSAKIWLVSNEVGAGLVPDYLLGRLFRNYQGLVNQKLAASADQVYWLVSGIPVRIKDGININN